ncbi:MAG TPA: methyltransferase domain-containing protein [Acidimicrobiales bacterium]|nr:methyltransferase domain-containing protein [Acidimicrobiales bacterium]
MSRFDDLVAEAAAAPITGWDFSWLDGRATEARPSWRYRDGVAERAARSNALLEIECGDGTLLRSLRTRPALVVATEAYQPGPDTVCARADELPCRNDAFDLVISRHPVVAHWDEIARVLLRGGTYFAQHVGPRSAAEISEWFLGPQRHSDDRSPDRAQREAERVGLTVTDLRHEALPMTFDDVGAVVYFLRLVVWIVPGFRVERYRDRLQALHRHIAEHGPFRATSTRFLIEARKGTASAVSPAASRHHGPGC